MRILLLLPALFTTILVLGCDAKPAKPPTPKIESPASTDPAPPPAKTAPRDEAPAQSGY